MNNPKTSIIPLCLLLLYVVEAVLLGIAPVDRSVWWAENLTAWIPIAVIVLMYWRGIRFSNTAYCLMFVFFALHTIGGHYTFEHVPIDAVTRLFGFERNHYDRLCHFLVGLFAFPTLEYLEENRLVRGRRLLCLLTVMSIFGFAAIFELIEWCYAALADTQSGTLFLGSQGDIWDAQKDMLADGLGAICTTAAYCFIRPAKTETPWPLLVERSADASAWRLDGIEPSITAAYLEVISFAFGLYSAQELFRLRPDDSLFDLYDSYYKCSRRKNRWGTDNMELEECCGAFEALGRYSGTKFDCRKSLHEQLRTIAANRDNQPPTAEEIKSLRLTMRLLSYLTNKR